MGNEAEMKDQREEGREKKSNVLLDRSPRSLFLMGENLKVLSFRALLRKKNRGNFSQSYPLPILRESYRRMTGVQRG